MKSYQRGREAFEAGLIEMLARMESGRFKVFADLNDWFEEFRLYHRKDGRVVKERDDLMAATRYGIMMLSYAEVPSVATDCGFVVWRSRGTWMDGALIRHSDCVMG